MQKGDSLLAHSRAQNHGLAQGWRMGWPFARSLRQQVSVLWEWWSQKNHTSSEPSCGNEYVLCLANCSEPIPCYQRLNSFITGVEKQTERT